MNDLYKTKKVLLGLKKHPSSSCASCPYDDIEDCSDHLMEDAWNVIVAQKEMMNRKEMTKAKAKPGFITLTAGVLYSSDGRPAMMEDKGRVAIRVDDILAVSDLVGVRGSEVWLNNAQQTTFYVCETIEEILGKIADMKGEEK